MDIPTEHMLISNKKLLFAVRKKYKHIFQIKSEEILSEIIVKNVPINTKIQLSLLIMHNPKKSVTLFTDWVTIDECTREKCTLPVTLFNDENFNINSVKHQIESINDFSLDLNHCTLFINFNFYDGQKSQEELDKLELIINQVELYGNFINTVREISKIGNKYFLLTI